VSAAHVADTGFIAALGGPENERYRRVRTFTRRNGVVFMLPERVYEELTASDTEPARRHRDSGGVGASRPFAELY
jgi:hypothetical protein